MVAALTSGQEFGLGVIILILAILIGYAVYRMTPKKLHPIIAGLMAANVFVAALAVSGMIVAGDMIGWFAGLSLMLGLTQLDDD